MSYWRQIEADMAELKGVPGAHCGPHILATAAGWGRGVFVRWFGKWEYDQGHPEAATEGGFVADGGRIVYPTHWAPAPPSLEEDVP